MKLKLCPFCKVKPKYIKKDACYEVFHKRGCFFNVMFEYQEPDARLFEFTPYYRKAINAWNKRM